MCHESGTAGDEMTLEGKRGKQREGLTKNMHENAIMKLILYAH